MNIFSKQWGDITNAKELRKLNRRELLEIILGQTKYIEQLEEEIECLKKKLDERRVFIEESGTLAEASLKLSEVFKAADDAIAIYVNNVKENLKCKDGRKKKNITT